ncbi:MAG TPA: hypothetical protein VJK30_03645 [Coxiellaceae bacterium]|nr:hypothetical protein [Coxiellaceae bacterium]
MKTKIKKAKVRKKPNNLGEAFKLLTKLPGDFMPEGRNDLPPQKRNFKRG